MNSAKAGRAPGLLLRSALSLLLGAAALSACSSVVAPSSSTTTGTGGGGGSGGSGGSGGGGGSPPVSCAWAKKTSDATCPAGACPILLDEELTCDDSELGAPGVRVAPAPDATWVVTSSSNDRLVYRLTGGGEERQDGVPKGFARAAISLALAPDGAPELVADTTTQPDYAGGVTHAALAGGAWSASVVFDRDDKYTPIIDFEVGHDGKPRVWFVSDAPDAHTLATPDGKGGWTLAPQPGDWARFTLAGDDSIMPVGLVEGANSTYQLRGLVGGDETLFGGPFSTEGFAAPVFVLAAPPPATPSGLLFGAAIAESDGIHTIVARAAAPVTEGLVAGVAPPTGSCSTPADDASCTGTCHNTGEGMETGAFALAWTDDGTAWLAYVVTSVDQTIGYSLQGDPGVEFCVGNVEKDSSKGTLHLVRAPLDGSAPEEVLTMPIARPGGGDAFTDYYSSGRFVDVRGSGKELAIGVRTGWIGGPNAVRVLRIDTTKL